ncbi:MAG: amidohydrolase [Chloroflexi bacterium]|nr:amidohydrolase [Chloroflexota bacterium]
MVESLTLAQRVRMGLALTDELVIDAHAHLGVFKDYFVPQPGADDLVNYMDRYGTDVACIFGFAGVNSDFVYGNDLVADAVRRYPKRFVGYTTLSANYPEDLIPELERCHALGLRGIKLISIYQGHPEDTERFIPVYDWANAHHSIVLSHQWGPPEFLARIAAQYPRVCFIIGHLNVAYAPIVRQHENVYTTTTFVPSPVAIVQAVESFGAEKILFGSDFPDLDVSLNVGPLLTARISDEHKRMILGRTMQRLLSEHA